MDKTRDNVISSRHFNLIITDGGCSFALKPKNGSRLKRTSLSRACSWAKSLHEFNLQKSRKSKATIVIIISRDKVLDSRHTPHIYKLKRWTRDNLPSQLQRWSRIRGGIIFMKVCRYRDWARSEQTNGRTVRIEMIWQHYGYRIWDRARNVKIVLELPK